MRRKKTKPKQPPRKCEAHTKSRQGAPCRAPAMPNGRCRVHGGPSTGPRTPEGLASMAAANSTNGPKSAKGLLRRGKYWEYVLKLKRLDKLKDFLYA